VDDARRRSVVRDIHAAVGRTCTPPHLASDHPSFPSAALASNVVASMPTVLPYDQPGVRQSLQHPREHGLVRVEIDQATREGNRRMIRRCVRQHQPEELAERKRVGRTPRDGALRVQPFEVPDQQQPEVAAGGRPGWPTSST
jgi:hypothetical protein